MIGGDTAKSQMFLDLVADSCSAATSHRSDDEEHSRRSGEWSRNVPVVGHNMTGVVAHVLLS